MKTITSNSRTDDTFGMFHLFEFDMTYFDGSPLETLRFTDHDVFVYDGTNEYTPLSITFNTLKEDFSMQSDNIEVMIDNINEELTGEALDEEWRNNRALITRVIYTPPSQTENGTTYEYGVADNSTTTYPRLEIASLTKDTYTLFEGVIDTFSATTQALNGSLMTKFSNWNKGYPSRTFNQNEFASIVGAMTDMVYWGRQKTL